MRFSNLFDFYDFYVMKCLEVGELGAEIIFFYLGQISIILALLAYAQCTLATIFDFEFAPKKGVSDSFEVHLNVSK